MSKSEVAVDYTDVREQIRSRSGSVASRKIRERIIEAGMFLCAVFSVAITVGIVWVLVYESWNFFRNVSIIDFLTDTQWTVLFENPRYGIMPLVTGTLVTSMIALVVALPLGTIIAIYLSEYANSTVREILKPILELLSAVPTVVFGYFALLFITPMLQNILPELPGFNMLSAGIVIGIMIVPYISSLSEDAMKAVPVTIREGSYAMGATRVQTALRVLIPAAFSGIASAYVLRLLPCRRRDHGGRPCGRNPAQPDPQSNGRRGNYHCLHRPSELGRFAARQRRLSKHLCRRV